jgi:hypothetical protein
MGRMKKRNASAAGHAPSTRSDPSLAAGASHAALNTGRSPGAATDRLSWINSGLMVAACGVAFLAPFHLFLFAYAVLGPLHYITEISWLHDRSYFAKRHSARRWWLILVAATMMVLMFGFISNDLLHRPVPPKYEIAMVYLVLATASMVLYIRRAVNATALAAAAVVAIALFSETRTFFLFAYFSGYDYSCSGFHRGVHSVRRHENKKPRGAGISGGLGFMCRQFLRLRAHALGSARIASPCVLVF